MTGDLAPIALFTYRRPKHTERVIRGLASNPEAVESDLIAFIDGPRNALDVPLVENVREVLHEAVGFKSVTIHQAAENLGLANSITQGITKVLNEREKIIVIEDDILVSRYFLRFMNQGLDTYANSDLVASIHGYSYPVSEKLPETFFIRGADCWGWATWSRAWSLYNPSGEDLIADVLRNDQIEAFNFSGAADYLSMLRAQISGENDSWAVRWYASAFLSGKLTLYPGRSLVRNIGNDGSGEHSGSTSRFDNKISDHQVDVTPIPLVESRAGREAFTRFFRNQAKPKFEFRWNTLMEKLRKSVARK